MESEQRLDATGETGTVGADGKRPEDRLGTPMTGGDLTISKFARLALVFIVLLENLIAFRIAFRFLGASENFVVVKFLYLISEPLVKPFLTALPWSIDTTPTSVFEGSSIAVVILLTFANYLIERFVLKTRELSSMESR